MAIRVGQLSRVPLRNFQAGASASQLQATRGRRGRAVIPSVVPDNGASAESAFASSNETELQQLLRARVNVVVVATLQGWRCWRISLNPIILMAMTQGKADQHL